MTPPLAPPREPDTRLRGWRRWWLLRLPRTDTLSLNQHNLYILPTRAGWMLAITLLLLLIGSINFQLNLGYLLTFMLTGCAAVSVLVTHRNLHGMRLQWQACPGQFAGQALQLRLQLRNDGRWTRHAVAVRCMDLAPARRAAETALAWADVPAHDSVNLEVACPALPRGRWAAPPVQAESNFPLGIFRTWCWWRPAASLLVYPAPEAGAPPLPMPGTGEQPDAPPAQPAPDPDELDELRTYRPGDPPKRLLWKKLAQHPDNPEQWTSRDFSPAASGDIWLDSSRCGLPEREAQFSRLCAWVLQAEQAGRRYGMRLPGLEIPAGQGTAHRQRCLEALACA